MRRKAKQRLEQSRRKGLLEAELRLNKAEAALLATERAIEVGQYEDAMIAMYRDADATQRAALEAEYQKVAGSSLKAALEVCIIKALQSQPRGDCDL